MVQPVFLARASTSRVSAGDEFMGKIASSLVVMALTPFLAQTISASAISRMRLMVVMMQASGLRAASTLSASLACCTTTPLSGPPKMDPISRPTTAGFTSKAATISAPFSYT